MPRDRKLPAIELKKEPRTDAQAGVADIMLEMWAEREPGNEPDFQEIADRADCSTSLVQKVYNRYMGPPGDDRVVRDIREDEGSITEYLHRQERLEEIASEIEEVFLEDIDVEELSREELDDLLYEVFREGMKYGRLSRELDGERDED